MQKSSKSDIYVPLAAHHNLLTSKISNGAYLYAEWLSVLSYV